MSNQQVVDEILEIKALIDVVIEALEASKSQKSSARTLTVALKKIEELEKLIGRSFS